MNKLDFQKMKNRRQPISMVTCYDYWTASIMNNTDIDCLLVGDSLAMVIHGHPSTIPADTELMALHTQAVRRGAPDKFIITDIPFLAHRKGIIPAMESVEKIIKAGANAVKIEGIEGHEDIIRYIVESGIPVMGHIGLTPQSFNQLGGFKVQNKTESSAVQLIEQGKRLEAAGCFSIVGECIPSQLGQKLAESIDIPVIGIGAGNGTDGQVLVLQDLLGVTSGYTPKFVRKFMNGTEMISDALNAFNKSVKEKTFPSKEESYNG